MRSKMQRNTLYSVALIILGLIKAHALNNGLAKTPPMAWSNWNIAGCNVNETFIQQQADLMVSKGLKDAGYNYVIVDDCWSNVARSADGKLVANTTTFPSGMKALSDYVHNLGLKFGMYSDAGNMTCQFHPGSLGYETVDAQSFADWGVDYLKYDNCHASAENNVIDRYAAMSKALNKTGRPILYSIVGWGVGDPWRGWGGEYGNLWRTDGDITQSWSEITRVLDNSVGLMKYSAPYAWADMDMLEVGVGALTFQEMRAHFALWALMKSPLMLGTNLATFTPDQLKLVTNKEVIAVNQDSLGIPGDLVWKEGPYEVYAAPLSDGSRAVCLFNRHTLATQYKQENITVEWEWLGISKGQKAFVRNILDKVDLGEHTGSISGQVIVHDVLMLKITPTDAGKQYNNWRAWDTREYVGANRATYSTALYISFAVVLGIIFVPLFCYCLYLISSKSIAACKRRRASRTGGFQRFDDPKEKAHRSPNGRGVELA